MRSVILIGLCATAMSSFAQSGHVTAAGGSYIGVMMQEVDADRAKALKLGEPAGVELTIVEQEGPAEKAGLKVGDVVLRYNGQRVEGNEQFARLVRETPAGRDVKVEISRGGANQTVVVHVAQRKTPKVDWGESQAMPTHFEFRMPELPRSSMQMHSSILGLDVESIDGQLAQYFGVKEGSLVRSVSKGSAADKAGIRAGDVIVKVEDAHIANPAEMSNRLRALHGKSVAIGLMRDHKEVTVSIAVADDDPGRILITPYQVNQNQF